MGSEMETGHTRGRHAISRRVTGASSSTTVLSRAYSECGLLTVSVVIATYLTVPATCLTFAMIVMGPAVAGIRTVALIEVMARFLIMGTLLLVTYNDDNLRQMAHILVPRREPVSVTAIALLFLFPVARLASLIGGVGDGVGMGTIGMGYYVARACYVGVMEELIFRGLLPPVLARRLDGSIVGIASSLAFALMHVPVGLAGGVPNAIVTVTFAFLFGIAANGVADCCGSIVPGMVVHAIYDSIGMLSAF